MEIHGIGNEGFSVYHAEVESMPSFVAKSQATNLANKFVSVLSKNDYLISANWAIKQNPKGEQ